MIHELRIYRTLPGRMPALLKRFETATLRIWEKHGIKQAGFWTTLIGGLEQRPDPLAGVGVARRPRDPMGGMPC